MPFRRHPAVKGLVYCPANKKRKKHPCKDCFNCLFCSDDRCAACLNQCQKKQEAGSVVKTEPAQESQS